MTDSALEQLKQELEEAKARLQELSEPEEEEEREERDPELALAEGLRGALNRSRSDWYEWERDR
jgi:hypothetical protein